VLLTGGYQDSSQGTPVNQLRAVSHATETTLNLLDFRTKQLFSMPRLIELRWLGTTRRSLFTSDINCIEAGVSDPTVDGLSIYAVINLLSSTVIERKRITPNRIFRPVKGQCSGDTDIRHRILLPLDWDPVRAVGTAATDEQRLKSATQADATISYLYNGGFPEPAALVDSGNGRHGYFRLDAPNDDHTDFLLTAFYSALAQKFDTPDVKLDKSVRSAAQLMRLPGSFNQKAQRMCEILSFSGAAKPVSLDLIQKVTQDLRSRLGYKRRLAVRRGSWTIALVEAFLDFYDIDYLSPTEIPQGLLYVLNPCPLNSEHVGSSPAILLTNSGFPKFCCKHASCQMSWKDFRGQLFRLTKKWFFTAKGVVDAEQ
jgi:hypothetical protein